MKILIVNRNYFITGGPDKYLFSLVEMMPKHHFIPFAVNFGQSHETPYRKYFLPPPGGPENVYFKDFNLSIFDKIFHAIDMIYYLDARKSLENLIRDTKPDVAMFLGAHYFSDSIIDACRRFNLPIIWRLSDFNRICASALLYRNGHVCEECLEKGLFQGVVNRCGGYQGSLSVALVRFVGMSLSRFRRIHDHISYFIAPSQFTRVKMIKGGIDGKKIVCIPTFVTQTQTDLEPCKNLNSILYVGRLSHEKGVHVLIDAFIRLRNRNAVLTIVGDINSDYAHSLTVLIPEDVKSRIHFIGFKNQKEIAELFKDHSFFVVSSLCYENLPNVVLEGMANARPAIVSALGSLIETVKDGATGCHFEAGNPHDLANKIDYLLANPSKVREMGIKAYNYVKEHHSPQKHVAALESLIQSCVSSRK